MVIIKISMETKMGDDWTEWFAKKIQDDVINPNGMLIPSDLKIEVQKTQGE